MSAVLLAAGGTGGHMVPADAVAHALGRRGHPVALLTDARGLRFPGLFEGIETHVIPAATPGGNPLRWPDALAKILAGRREGRAIIARQKARAVVGFGGYPALPAMLAGRAQGVVTLLHEQNAVLGRVNRLLARRVSVLALSWPETARVPAGARTVVTGNPVRERVLAQRDMPFRAPGPGEPFRLLVVGGSQGARILTDVVPAAVARLEPQDRARLAVVHQARHEDVERAEAAYRAAGVAAECLPYMADLPERMAEAHLVVARSGASTMAELAAMGRAAVLVPFAAATDDHQWANAQGFADAGAGLVYREAQFNPDALAGALAGFLHAPERLAAAAAAAKGLGVPEAAERLADLVEAEMGAAA
ncbi:MAG: UDP-N-acetylglucosamine--N-acetylmuramyl-(pentapeptide) pyrophosphoryl-undecaprenol N-acetylglucosamine transferase [Sphingomonadaceae bacterium]